MNPDTKKDLKESYHYMLDRARYAFEEGKESLEEALRAATHELEKLGTHTDEEIHQLGSELQEDLKEASLQAHELREGLREMIDFEKQYLGKEALAKLMSLADKNTLDMLTFKEELAERQLRRDSVPKKHT